MKLVEDTNTLRLRIVHDDAIDAEAAVGETPGVRLVTCHRTYTIGESASSAEAIYTAMIEDVGDSTHREIVLLALQSAEGEDREQLKGYILDYPGDYESVLQECCDLGPVQSAILDSYPFPLLPVYMYEHGGATINTGGFSCPWDSGQIGYIWAENSDWTEDQLRGIVKAWDYVLRGACWGFVAESLEGGEWQVADSCFGFLGDPADCGIADHLPEEYLPLLEDAAESPEYPGW